jgi:TRAP-type uncharacterized transport system fused permease subunit
MATIPTILYYLSIWIMIDAGATGTQGTQGTSGTTNLPSESSSFDSGRLPAVSLIEEKDAREVSARHQVPDVPCVPCVPCVPDVPAVPAVRGRQYVHFLSLVLVALLMASGFTPFRAVFWATLVAIVLSWIGAPDERLGPRGLTRALTAGGNDILPVLATTAVAGIIVGVVTLTGLGLKAAGLIVGLAGGSLPLTVFFAALAVWMLGLAVPVTASYIIAAVMVAPALTTVGVPLVAAHMFIFYYAVLSEVSPPTALAPFAAAALTGGRPFRSALDPQCGLLSPVGCCLR